MKIVGVGCGPGMLTEQAIYVISKASLIYGSDRAIAIARQYIPPGCVVKTIDDYKSLHTAPQEAVLLSTGDPMLAGLGYLDGEVTPGISSLQYAAARLRIPLARVSVVVAHGKGHEKGMTDTIAELGRGKIVFLLPDPKFDAGALYRMVMDAGVPARIAVCENLGYPDERIATGSLEELLLPKADLYSLFIGNF
jgi:cobalt-precorrin-7 (C5)-methyltransferase